MERVRARLPARLQQLRRPPFRSVIKPVALTFAVAVVACASYSAGWKRHEQSLFHGDDHHDHIVVALEKHYGSSLSSATGPSDPLDAHRRFWQSYTRRLQVRNGAALAVFTVPVIEEVGIRWIGQLLLGSPGQYFRAVFDTGSSLLWVRQEVQRPMDDPFENRFNPGESHTYEASELTLKHSFPRGVCGGVMGRDTMTLGNSTVHMRVDTEFLNVWRGRLYIDAIDFDGVLGLGWWGLLPSAGDDADDVVDTPLSNVHQVMSDHMRNPTFSFHQRTCDENEYDEEVDSYLLLGKNPGKQSYPRGIQWLDLAESESSGYGHWMVEVDTIKMGSFVGKGRAAVVDASTRCLVMPESDAALFFDEAIAVQTKDKKCSALPTITFSIQGQAYELTGADYGVPIPGGCKLCVLGNPDITWWVLGEVFQRKYQVTYDFTPSSPRLGLPVVKPRYTLVLVHGLLGLLVGALAVALLKRIRRQRRGGAATARSTSTAVAATAADPPLMQSGMAGDAEAPAQGDSSDPFAAGGESAADFEDEENATVASRVADIERQASIRR
mmetsp:Transcript_52132/g.124176  ORF Transcript_52132/g.124176 Transcript_52132/m.124176 type:complete len:553 (+) Transcript_52132:87-1745(+)